MDWVNALGGIMGTFLSLGLALAQTWLVATTVRRLLGVRVGWPRAFLVSLITIAAAFQVIFWLLSSGRLGLPVDEIADTTWMPVLLAAGLVLLWSFALGAAILVALEVIVPTGSLPPLRSLVLGWRRRWRRGRRYAEIMAIAARHGLGAQLRGLRPPGPGSAPETAVALRRLLEDAGVTFTKLGQMLSTRADLLPAPYIAELSRLQNAVAPLPWDVVREEIEREVGRPIVEVFAEVDPEPLASASVAQVHSARLLDGTPVVLKAQRPDAAEQADLDLEIMLRIATTLERNAEWARVVGVRRLARGFADSLREELDYLIEADNMRALRATLDADAVRIPRVYEEFSSARLLVMEEFSGVPVVQAEDLIARLSPEQRTDSASVLLRSVLGQIVTEGVFHADLHPGNVVIWPDGAVGLLDFGSVGRLDADSRQTLALLLWAIDADDPGTATDCVLELLDRPAGLDERELQRSIGKLLARFRGGTGPGGTLKVFSELFTLVIGYHFTVPPEIAAALRSLGALEGTLKHIDPGLDLVAVARSVGRSTMGDLTPARVKDEITSRAIRLLPLLEHLPRRINRITEELERGAFTTHVRVISHPDDRRFLIGLVQQLVIALLSGASVIGGILLATSPGGPPLLPNLSAFAFLGYLLAFAGFVLALRAVALVFGRPWQD